MFLRTPIFLRGQWVEKKGDVNYVEYQNHALSSIRTEIKFHLKNILKEAVQKEKYKWPFKHIKRYSTSLIMQIVTRWCFLPITLAKVKNKKVDNLPCWGMQEKQHSRTSQKWIWMARKPLWKEIWWHLSKFKMHGPPELDSRVGIQRTNDIHCNTVSGRKIPKST